MVDPVCVATLSGTDCAPLVLQTRRVELREDGVFVIASYWDEDENFLEALHRKYDRLSIAWYDASQGVDAEKVNEVLYTSSAPFAITGDLVAQGEIVSTFSLATIQIHARQSVYA